LNLVGTSLQLSGILQDGTRFDWDKYRGQHTLVCFWATYAPWLEEAKRIAEIVKPYQQQLQVVTINLDDRKTIDEFCKGRETQLIWPTVVSSDPNVSGFEQSNASLNGVVAIPFLVLVGPDGVVKNIHVFGDRLTATIQETFAP
jgi:hypothetical protein